MPNRAVKRPATSSGVATVRTVAALRRRVCAWRAAGERIALVPTMGYLHAGHMALIAAARAACARTVVSIFVNPRQFVADEDFDTYPRDSQGDLGKLRDGGADLAFVPDVAEIYPPGFATGVTVAGVSEGLCGSARPGHFDGVSTVVTKLLLQCLPDDAFFGEKDYQQIQVVRRLVTDLDIPVTIHQVPTVREADGLAISSRNVYLSADERARAPRLYRVLKQVAGEVGAGMAPAQALAAGIEALHAAGIAGVEYLELRDAETLAPVETVEREARVLAAIRLGRTRLIDNIGVRPPRR